MSFLSFLGKGVKAIGKVVVGAGKAAVNIAGTAVGVGQIFPSGGSQQAAVPSIDPNQAYINAMVLNGGAQQATTPSLLDALKGLAIDAGHYLGGRTATQNNVNVGTQSGIPPWVPIIGIGGLLVYFMSKSSGGNSRRY